MANEWSCESVQKVVSGFDDLLLESICRKEKDGPTVGPEKHKGAIRGRWSYETDRGQGGMLLGGFKFRDTKKIAPVDEKPKPAKKPRVKILDLAFRALSETGSPLHISEMPRVIKERCGVEVKQASLLARLADNIGLGGRFERVAPNTYAIRSLEETLVERSRGLE